MRKAFGLLLALAVMLTVVLGLGVCASADGLPREKVGYGFGMPEAAAVPAHDLTDDGLTLDGVSYNARIEDGKVYIRIVDLAAVNLLRENASAAEELGLDSSDLYIERGLILVKPDGKTAEEIAGVEAKLAALKAQSAPIGVSVGDEYILASGGADRLIVEVGELAYPSSAPTETEKTSEEAPADTSDETPDDTPTEPEKTGMNVVSKGSAGSSGKPAETTVYFIYNRGMTYCLAESNMPSGDKTEIDPAAPSAGYNYTTDKIDYYGCSFGIVRGEDDTNKYYVFVDFGDGNEPSFVYVNTGDGFSDIDKDSGKRMSVIQNFSGEPSEDNPKQDKLAKKIYISTDGTMNGLVKTIELNDATPSADKFFKSNSNEPVGTAPEGYTKLGGNTYYDRGYEDKDGNELGQRYGYSYEQTGETIDIENPTSDVTTVNVRNNVTAITDFGEASAYDAADIQPTGDEPTPVVTDTLDIPAVDDAPIIEDAPVETEIEIDPELA